MMLPTHALVGLLIAVPVVSMAPEATDLVLLAGLAGGVFPDLDMYIGHRKTLHYPVVFSLASVVAVLVAVLLPSQVTIAGAIFLVAAAVHSVSDMFGGGLELRPWEATSDRAVYDHFRGKWIQPRRWVYYDGSPGDLALSLVLAVPLWITFTGWPRWVVAGLVAIGAVYTAVRRVLPAIAVALTSTVPRDILSYVPRRYLGMGRTQATDEGNVRSKEP